MADLHAVTEMLKTLLTRNNDGDALQTHKDVHELIAKTDCLVCIKTSIINQPTVPLDHPRPSPPMYLAFQDGCVYCVTRILEADADPNAKDYEGNTPLHLVVCNGSAECVKLLLEAGADPTDYEEDTSETGSSSDE